METSNPLDIEFKIRVIKMLNELSEDLNSIKKVQSEMKDTLINLTIYRESTVEWMKSRIKSAIWNTSNQKPIRTTRRKIIQKNENSVRSL